MRKYTEEKRELIPVPATKAYVKCEFQRTKKSEWETGLAIFNVNNVGSYDIEAILDLNNKVIKKPVWTYNLDTSVTIIDNHLII